MRKERICGSMPLKCPFSLVFCGYMLLLFFVTLFFPVSASPPGTETLITTDIYKNPHLSTSNIR